MRPNPKLILSSTKEVLISPSMNYNNYLYNRKNNTINYTGSRYDVKHVMDIVNIDKDIDIESVSLIHRFIHIFLWINLWKICG